MTVGWAVDCALCNQLLLDLYTRDKLRYIFYRNTNAKKDAKSNEVTLVYMEGYATLDEIEKMFK